MSPSDLYTELDPGFPVELYDICNIYICIRASTEKLSFNSEFKSEYPIWSEFHIITIDAGL